MYETGDFFGKEKHNYHGDDDCNDHHFYNFCEAHGSDDREEEEYEGGGGLHELTRRGKRICEVANSEWGAYS